MDLALQILWSLLGVAGAIAYGLVIGGVIRKVMARIQGRVGPPLWQPFLDLGKAVFLRTEVTHGPMFWLGPVFRFGGGAGMFLLVPLVVGVPELEFFTEHGDLLLVMYFMFFGSLGMALGASRGGHPHSPIGISRGLAQMTTFELPFSFAIVALVAATGSWEIEAIVAAQQGGVLDWNLFQHPLAAAAAFLAFLGMNMYSPFDIVGAPNEIPVGPRTEYHSAFQSMLMSGRTVFGIAKMVLFMNLFLGGAGTLWVALLKIFALYFWSVFVGAVNPRFRPDQSLNFFLRWPAVFGVAAVLVVML